MLDRNLLANPAMWLEPANDGRHQLRDAPAMRESIPYIVSLPEDGGYADPFDGYDGPLLGRFEVVVRGDDGSLKVMAHDPSVAEALRAAEIVMDENRDLLQALA